MIRRRLYIEVRYSRLATLARRIGIFALPVVALAIALHRLGLVEYRIAYVTLAAGLAVALLAVLVAAAAFVVIWNEGLRGVGRAFTGMALGAAVLAVPAYDMARGVNLPALHDITTDPDDPPPFQAVAAARPSGANPVTYPGNGAAELQYAAYPAVKPFELDARPDEVFNLALSIVERRGWRILDSVSPRGGQREGRIEAVALTPIMGFREDVSIRVRAIDQGTRIDLRSASRYGSHDFGSNARRIESFLAEFIEARRRGR